MLRQRHVDFIIDILLFLWQVNENFGASVRVAFFKVQNAFAQGTVGGILIGSFEGGVDVQAPRISLGAILGENELAHGFGHKLCMNFVDLVGNF